MTDNDIIEYFTIKTSGRIAKYKIERLSEDSEIYQYLSNRFDDTNSLVESLYRIVHNIEILEKCPICGKRVYFRDFKLGYLKTCESIECINKRRSIISSFRDKNVQDKCKQTIMKKYGVSNPFNISEVQKKCIENAQKKEAKEKRKNTIILKYGVDNVSKNEQIKQKIKETHILKYGDLYRNTEEYVKKMNKISLEKYGTKWPSQSQYTKEKVKNTCIRHFGLSSYLMTQECQEKSHSKESLEKIIETKRRNHTFNTSKQEETTYQLLKERYPDVVRQYRSDKYPFACDFYIPSLDLYIECNYHWTHGGKPFEGTDEDKKKIENWKSKNTKYYDNAIYAWSILDVKKRNIAKENGLNYIEIWNMQNLYDTILCH